MSKVIVITGASSGIGEATAKILAKDGGKIVLGARREDKLKKLAEEVKNLGGEAVYSVTDVTKVEEVEALAKLAIDTFGKIDVWLNNAGIMPSSPMIKKDIKSWDAIIDTNIKGVMYGIGAALPYMYKQKSGHIINISSVAGHIIHAGNAAYAASKWAVRAISDTLRQEVAQDNVNIRVTNVSPGAINTELVSSLPDSESKKRLQQFYDAYAIPVERIALTIKQAIDMDEDTAWNEIIIRPTKQVL
ncbi:SDR family oxidoreductase [Fusobacterium simiae]|uniref:SDR family oxidoreductase n=1 Tax=Fusobacterium simiae TaxID=855 RepID=A0ABT4DKD5_FUSSI|nr:SDR family oxidoreductase [Fusobacterium simiae]MCY7009047.1 SDR family oxidoreductase [Fusobacterium simiae]